MRYLLLIVLLLCGIADAKPAPKEQPPPSERTKKPPAVVVPDLALMLGESNYGTVTQHGRDVQFSGHERWEATGHIRDDGTLLLAWTLLSTGQVCPGVYRVEGDKLQGHWGYPDRVTIEPDGSLSGSKSSETLYRVAMD